MLAVSLCLGQRFIGAFHVTLGDVVQRQRRDGHLALSVSVRFTSTFHSPAPGAGSRRYPAFLFPKGEEEKSDRHWCIGLLQPLCGLATSGCKPAQSQGALANW
jgi:hypothetical protein